MPSSYEEDCSHYTKRPADRIFKIQRDLVSTSKIDDWWLHNRPSEPYHLLARNCATVVKDALVVGSRHLGHILLLKLLSLKWSVTPMHISAFCILMQKKFWDIVKILLGKLFLIGLAIVVFINLLNGSQTFPQAILLCLRTILIISSLIKYVELLMNLSSMTLLVLTYHFMIYMIQMFVHYFYDFNDIYTIDPDEDKRFTLWMISYFYTNFLSRFFNLSTLKAGFLLLTFLGIQFASLSILYDIYDIFILLFIVIFDIEHCFRIIEQPVCNNRTIGTQTDGVELIRSTNGLTITGCCIHAFMQIYLYIYI